MTCAPETVTLQALACQLGVSKAVFDQARAAGAAACYPFPPCLPERGRPVACMRFDAHLVHAWWRHLPGHDVCEDGGGWPATAAGEVRLAMWLHGCRCGDHAERVYRHALHRHGQDVVALLLLEEARARFRALNPDLDDEVYGC